MAEAATPLCPVCTGRRSALHHDQGHRRLRRCFDCGLVFADPLPTFEDKLEIERDAWAGEELAETADLYGNCRRDFKEDPAIRELRRGLEWIGSLREPGRLLDVGPGTGIFLFLASRDFGWQPLGIDVCEESAARAREDFDVPIDIGDLQDAPYEPGSFDCVTMLDVLEHTVDPRAFLRRAYELLAPGGVLYVVVPNQRSLMTVLLDRAIQLGAPGKSFFLDRLYVGPHVLYFSPPNLVRAIEGAGFRVSGVKGGNVYLGRYLLSRWVRGAMEIVLRAGRLIGMAAKIHVLAYKPVETEAGK